MGWALGFGVDSCLSVASESIVAARVRTDSRGNHEFISGRVACVTSERVVMPNRAFFKPS